MPPRKANSMTNVPTLRTAGVIASTLHVPVHRVVYILRTRDHITPSARAGRLWLYDLEAVAKIRHELNAITARNNKGQGVSHV